MIFIGLISCNPSAHFQKDTQFEQANWVKFNTLKYDIPVEAGKSYSFNGIITTDTVYTKRKMHIGFYLYLPSGEERLEDKTIRILSNEYIPLGEKKDGSYEIKTSFKQNILIKETGNLKLQIVHHSQYLDNFGIKNFKLIVNED